MASPLPPPAPPEPRANVASPPRIPPLCIDGRMLGTMGESGTGVAQYARLLVGSLTAAGTAPWLLDDGGQAARRGRWRLWAAAVRPGIRRLAAHPGGLNAPDIFREAHVHFLLTGRLLRLAAPGPAGVIHWTYPLPLRIEGWRNIYTVHDAIPLTHPDLTPIPAARHRRLLTRIAATADRIVTVSESARADIVTALECPPDLVMACWQAVDVGGDAPPPPPPLVPGGYLLFCGSIEPRKNLARLIAAYRTSGVAIPLVLAGPDGWRGAAIAAQAAATPGVVRLPYQDRAELLGLIAHARALLFPTLAEGFGLPVAEAMALGTPVLTSASGALAEIAGGACLTVDPLDEGALARGIDRIATDDALCATLRAAGLARSAAFAPRPYADWLLALYAGA